MSTYSLSHLSDQTLLAGLATLVARDRATTAELLAHLAEVDERRLYLPAAYPSMFAWCVGELGLSEDAAFKRIQAARAARRFPAIFAAVADGRLHLSGIGLLAAHLTETNATELLAAASHRTKSEIERMLAERFPRPDLSSWVGTVPTPAVPGATGELAPGQVEGHVDRGAMESPRTTAGPVQLAPGQVAVRPRMSPLSPGRFGLQVTIARATYDKLQRARGLLGHQVPSGDLAEVLDRALDALIERLERRKFAATPTPRAAGGRRRSGDSRHVPAHVRRAVWARDHGRCTFTSETGRRCEARTRLEFDHVQAYARGGEADASGLRLRCRAHNQYAAECAFGSEFMRRKREDARCAAAERSAGARAKAGRVSDARARQPDPEGTPADQDVVPWLRSLGFRADEARRAAARCVAMPGASLETRVRLALRHLAPPHRRVPAAIGAAG